MSVPTSNPLIMTTAMLLYMGSVKSGNIPKMVVNEAISTGLVREMVALIMA